MIMVEYDRTLSHPPRSTHYQAQSRDPHYQHLEHHSAPSTPSPPYNYAHLSPFAQQQQSSSVRSTPTSYPSPASYPSPSMSAYNYPPQQGHHSPHFQQMNVSNYNLPPMRMTPPNTALPPPIIQSGSQLPPPHQMYYAHGPAHSLGAPPISHITSSPQPLRFPLPQVTPERIMSGGRHKKEIKRRTKTGCLTCRKRRIKCDEAHPTCKNCAKSKRDCMGYDPIFKPQPGPAAIQPAPSSAGSAQLSSSVPYGVPNSAVGGMVYASVMSTAGSPPASSCEPYYPVDPTLEASAPPAHPGGMSILVETSTTYRPDLKRTYDRASPLSDTARPSTTPMGRSVTPNPPLVRDSSANPAKRIKIDDLLTGASNGLPLTPPSGDQSLQPLSIAIDADSYRSKYAIAMDVLIETGWFRRNMDIVTRVGHLGEQFVGLCTRFQSRAGVYMEEEDPNLGSLGGDAEAYLDSIRLVYGTRAPAKTRSHMQGQEGSFATPSDTACRNETIKRIAVVEALVTGSTKVIELGSPQVSPKSSPPHFGHQFGENSVFWRHLARFISLTEGIDPVEAFEATLKDMKNNTGGLRVRDLLCTIAEARHHFKELQLLSYNTPEAKRDKARLEDIFEREKAIVMTNAHTAFSPGGPPDEQLIRRIAARAMTWWGLITSHDTFIL